MNRKERGKLLFKSNSERSQMIVITGAFVLGGLVASGRPGNEEELVFDAYKLARRFVERGESLAIHGDLDDGLPDLDDQEVSGETQG